MWSKEGIIVLIVFTVANLFTYFTRYIPSVTKDLIKEDLDLNDFQTGLIFTVFICSYMVVSPLVGLISSHGLVKRKIICVVGLLLLSVATFLTGFCRTFGIIVLPRILFGIGEAMYCAISGPLLSDFFEPDQRSIVLSIYYAAMPIGCAIGFTVAGSVAEAIGWRGAFYYPCIPGILSIGMLFLREPTPGEKDAKQIITQPTEPSESNTESSDAIPLATCKKIEEPQEKESNSKSDGASGNSAIIDVPEDKPAGKKEEGKETLIDDYSSPSVLNARWVIAVGGYVAVTFGMGGFSDWLPTFFVREYDMNVSTSGTLIGGIIVFGGLFGTISGGLLGDVVKRYVTKRHPYMLFSSVTMLISTVFAILTLYQDNLIVVEIFIAICIFFAWCYNGPLNAVLLNCVQPEIRSLSNGLCMLIIHLFGDAISPSIIGWVSDSSYGDLKNALLLVPLSLFICSLVWFCGWLTLPSSSTFPCCPSWCYKFKESSNRSSKQVDPETAHLIPPSKD